MCVAFSVRVSSADARLIAELLIQCNNDAVFPKYSCSHAATDARLSCFYIETPNGKGDGRVHRYVGQNDEDNAPFDEVISFQKIGAMDKLQKCQLYGKILWFVSVVSRTQVPKRPCYEDSGDFIEMTSCAKCSLDALTDSIQAAKSLFTKFGVPASLLRIKTVFFQYHQ